MLSDIPIIITDIISSAPKNFISLTLNAFFIFPFMRHSSTAKLVVPIIISTKVTSLIPALLYSPMLFSLVENPPVDNEHIEWHMLSKRFIPNIVYNALPINKNNRYIKKMILAVFFR